MRGKAGENLAGEEDVCVCVCGGVCLNTWVYHVCMYEVRTTAGV